MAHHRKFMSARPFCQLSADSFSMPPDLGFLIRDPEIGSRLALRCRQIFAITFDCLPNRKGKAPERPANICRPIVAAKLTLRSQAPYTLSS